MDCSLYSSNLHRKMETKCGMADGFTVRIEDIRKNFDMPRWEAQCLGADHSTTPVQFTQLIEFLQSKVVEASRQDLEDFFKQLLLPLRTLYSGVGKELQTFLFSTTI